MNRLNFIIFFTVFFLLYGLINYYVFLRGWQAIPSDSPIRTPYAVVFWVVALSFIAGRFLERAAITPFSTAVVWVGSFWFAAFAYFALTALFIDILRLFNYIIPFFPSFITNNIADKRNHRHRTVLSRGGCPCRWIFQCPQPTHQDAPAAYFKRSRFIAEARYRCRIRHPSWDNHRQRPTQ